MSGSIAPTAATGGRRRGEVFLWVGTVLSVSILHAGLLMAAVLWLPSFDPPSLPTAAMIVELAPLAAPPAPATEMAPGIEQQAARPIEQKVDRQVEPKPEPAGAEVETHRFEPEPKPKSEPSRKPEPEIEKAETVCPEPPLQRKEIPKAPPEKPDEKRRSTKPVEEKITPIAKREPMVRKAEVVLPTPRPEPPRPEPASETLEKPVPEKEIVAEPVIAPAVDEVVADERRSMPPDDTAEIAEGDNHEPNAGKVVETPHVSEPPPAAAMIEEAPPAEKMVERTTAPVAAPAPPANRMSAPTPGLSSAVSRDAVLTWQGLLRLHLERHKRYPTTAQFHRQEGTSVIRFAMTRNGRVTETRLERSSGYSRLDDEALALPERAQPLPPPPPNISGKRIEIVVPIRFFLK